MNIKVEIDEHGNCTTHCPHYGEDGILMVGGGLCFLCNYHRGSGKDTETGEYYVICSKDM